jgi:GT2 family glycosyltransferase
MLSIVIPVFNKWNFTQACLMDLRGLPHSTHEIIVVDNNSTDDTQHQLLRLFSTEYEEVRYYKNSENLGFAKACNIGYSLARHPNVLFLNNDIRVKGDKATWTQSLIEKCATGLVGPTMGQLDSQLQFIKESNSVLSGNSYLSGWCVASSKENWSKLEIPRTGLMSMNGSIPQIFSEEFGLAYFEDTDLGFRARKLGIPMQVIDIPVVHFGKTTSSQLNTYALYKGAREIFVKKWHKFV